jgi:hypothetical protein
MSMSPRFPSLPWRAAGTVLLALALAAGWGGCRRDRLTTDPQDRLSFFPDTVQFDTVFSSVGSATRPLKVFNPHPERIRIDRIELAGGETSLFRVNVDGIPGILHEDVEILPEDSIYLFVEVTVDPNADRLPYVVEDSILFFVNGNRQKVHLVAWGQNAVFINGQRICDEVWTDELPYVIYNSMQVDSGCTLTIREGCRLHFHARSTMLVDGTLRVEGTADSVVTFEGDRLEPFFRDLPGQWPGIFILRGSTNNVLRHLVLKNSEEGILAGFSKSPDLADFSDANMPEIRLENVTIQDVLGNGIFSLRSDITAENLLIFNCGASNAALLLGGRYDFRHATLANYGSNALNHQTPVLAMANFFTFADPVTGGDLIVPADLEQADFRNVIVEGNIAREREIALGIRDDAAFTHRFDHCLLRTRISLDTLNAVDCIFRQDPLFADRAARNYQLTEGSPAIDAGLDLGISPDLAGNARPFAGTAPDLGALESGYEEE